MILRSRARRATAIGIALVGLVIAVLFSSGSSPDVAEPSDEPDDRDEVVPETTGSLPAVTTSGELPVVVEGSRWVTPADIGSSVGAFLV